MARKWEGRETRAGGQVRLQELRGASHYDSSSFFVAPGLDYNLKAAGQSKRPGKAWKTAVSQDAIRDRGLKARGRKMSPKHRRGSVK